MSAALFWLLALYALLHVVFHSLLGRHTVHHEAKSRYEIS